MIKKVLIMLMAVLLGMSASAGTWKIHPVTGAAPSNAVDAGNKVYYLVTGNLFCYDKETNENLAYDKSNYLNDTQITGIYYNYSKKYLLVAYTSSNIDMIYDDGSVVNIPDIGNALLTSSKTVNDVTFSGDRAYVATAFGYVAIDDKKHEVAESRIYNVNVSSVAKVGNAILLGTPSGVYYGDATKHHSTLSTYTLVGGIASPIFYALSDKTLILVSGNDTDTYSVSFDASNVPTGLTKLKDVVAAKPAVIQPLKSAGKVMIMFPANPVYHLISDDGTTTTSVTLPAAMKNEIATSQETEGQWWAVGANGIHKLSVSGTTATTLIDYMKVNASTVLNPYCLTYNAALDLLYVSDSGPGRVSGATWTYSPKMNILQESSWSEIAISGLQHLSYPQVFPLDPNVFVAGSWSLGLARFVNNKQDIVWNASNSKILANCTTDASVFDRDGNLWVIQGFSPGVPRVLPADKVKSAPSAADWIEPSITLDSPDWPAIFYACRKSDILVYTNGKWATPFRFFTANGNPAGAIKDVSIGSSVLDQDGNTYSWTRVYSMCEDNNGKLWIGTDNGIGELDVTKVFDPTFRVRRIKIPRNDGTNTADYLLEGIAVNGIAVDGANRKWIATNTNGLMLVSEDGSTILEHYTTANSVLPSDRIISVCCNPKSGSVYVGTTSGLLEYIGDSTAPAPSYDDVYVYPNPVRPDYTGMISIRGLMDNSLVKIADASGNVVATVQSTGGLATWDGCSANGDRVASGVYYVLASENEDETSSAVVTKFLVVR